VFSIKKTVKKKANDKAWIAKGLIKSSKVKARLYKKWISTRRLYDEIKYKNYRKIYRKVANEAECKYYKTMFDQKTNSIKQLWKNLNTVCSFKQGKSRSNSISKLNVNGVTLHENKDICNGFNNYFSTVGQNLVDDLIKNNKNTNVCDFKTYCPR